MRLGKVLDEKGKWQRGFTDHRIRDEQDFGDIATTFIRIQ
jgi:hypothetical protein